MIIELIRAFLLIFVAEMGDKTQIIAMTFATQYKVKEVILGVIIGVVFNHGIAIILGRVLSKFIPMDLIQIIAGIMFVLFGIMSLRDEETDGTDNKRVFSPVATVALAFFIGELGDKTQLTAMTLSSEGSYPLFILIGTTLGMVATSGLGIFVGSRIGEKIPEVFIKIASSIVFIFFGTIKLLNTLPKAYINMLNIVLYLAVILIIGLYLTKKLITNSKKLEKSAMQQAASKLYIQTKLLNEKLDNICLGKGNCGECIGSHCLIGYTRFILKEARKNGNYHSVSNIDINSLIKKEFNIEKVIEALSIVVTDSINNNWIKKEDFVIDKIRTSLEMFLFNEKLNHDLELDDYLKESKEKNSKYGLLLEQRIKSILN